MYFLKQTNSSSIITNTIINECNSFYHWQETAITFMITSQSYLAMCFTPNLTCNKESKTTLCLKTYNAFPSHNTIPIFLFYSLYIVPNTNRIMTQDEMPVCLPPLHQGKGLALKKLIHLKVNNFLLTKYHRTLLGCSLHNLSKKIPFQKMHLKTPLPRL